MSDEARLTAIRQELGGYQRFARHDKSGAALGGPLMAYLRDVPILLDLVASHARAVEGPEPALDVEAMRTNLHATFNGGWHHSEDGMKAFHHGMDTVCNVLASRLKGEQTNGIFPDVVAARPHEQEQVVQDTWKAQAERGVEQFQTLMTEHLALRDALTAKDQQLEEQAKRIVNLKFDMNLVGAQLGISKREEVEPAVRGLLQRAEKAETALAEARQQIAALRQTPISLNDAQEQAAKEWAADDRLWTTQETVGFNLRTFARVILSAALSASRAPQGETPAPKESLKP